jgi:hypothetical protein
MKSEVLSPDVELPVELLMASANVAEIVGAVVVT